MVDGFSWYNQITMHPDDREKTTFTTPWGTFMYDKMPFGLMNAGDTFQRAMDIAFVGERDKFVVIYLDDITFFSQSYDEHLMWKLNPVIEQFYSQQLSIVHAKSLTKETENGDEH